MKKELIGKSIVQLEGIESRLKVNQILLRNNVDDLKKDKNLLTKQIININNNVDNGNIRYKEILEESKILNSKNTILQGKNILLDGNIALLSIKEQENNQSINKQVEILNNGDITLDKLNKDIQDIKKEKERLSNTNISIIQDNIKKNQEQENIEREILKFSNILNNINKDIEIINKREKDLDEKENYLIIKASRLVKKESRLNDFKKDLLSKK